MKTLETKIRAVVDTINFDGLRCTMKGDPSIRDIKEALARQKEMDSSEN